MPIKQTQSFRRWLFEVGTRVIEVINALVMTLFALTFLLDFDAVIKTKPYQVFSYLSSSWVWLAMLALGIVQIASLYCTSIRSNQLSALILLWSGCIWSIIAILFAANYPPLSSAVTTYAIIALVTFFAGKEMLDYNKAHEDKGHGD